MRRNFRYFSPASRLVKPLFRTLPVFFPYLRVGIRAPVSGRVHFQAWTCLMQALQSSIVTFAPSYVAGARNHCRTIRRGRRLIFETKRDGKRSNWHRRVTHEHRR